MEPEHKQDTNMEAELQQNTNMEPEHKEDTNMEAEL